MNDAIFDSTFFSVSRIVCLIQFHIWRLWKKLIIQFHIWRLWKNACHTIFIENLKTVLNVFREILLFSSHLLNLSAQQKHDFNFGQKMLVIKF